MKKILFIGGYYTEKLEKEIYLKEDQTLQTAANEFQKHLIEGFISNGYKVDVLSVPFIKNYTLKNKDFYFSTTETYRDEFLNIEYLNFLNVYGLKNISRARKLKKKIKNLTKQNYFDKIDFIYIYSAHTPFLSFLKSFKKKNKIPIVLNILDLPLFMRYKMGVITRTLKKIEYKIFLSRLKLVDKFINITKYVSKELNIPDSKCIVVEGISRDISSLRRQCARERLITYTGTLNNEGSNILGLVKAFNLIDTDASLMIAGDGDAKEKIIQAAKFNNRINYLGKISHEESVSLQKKSWVLVNPRTPKPNSKFSFPSKTVEYLSSGTPVICAKLDGIPEEYDEVLYYFDYKKDDSLKNMLINVLNLKLEEINYIGVKNQEFIMNKKTKKITTKKIIDFIKGEAAQ